MCGRVFDKLETRLNGSFLHTFVSFVSSCRSHPLLRPNPPQHVRLLPRKAHSLRHRRARHGLRSTTTQRFCDGERRSRGPRNGPPVPPSSAVKSIRVVLEGICDAYGKLTRCDSTKIGKLNRLIHRWTWLEVREQHNTAQVSRPRARRRGARGREPCVRPSLSLAL